MVRQMREEGAGEKLICANIDGGENGYESGQIEPGGGPAPAGPAQNGGPVIEAASGGKGRRDVDRKSTRLNSSHLGISYAVFCLKKKRIEDIETSLDKTDRLHKPTAALHRARARAKGVIARHARLDNEVAAPAHRLPDTGTALAD